MSNIVFWNFLLAFWKKVLFYMIMISMSQTELLPRASSCTCRTEVKSDVLLCSEMLLWSAQLGIWVAFYQLELHWNVLINNALHLFHLLSGCFLFFAPCCWKDCNFWNSPSSLIMPCCPQILMWTLTDAINLDHEFLHCFAAVWLADWCTSVPKWMLTLLLALFLWLNPTSFNWLDRFFLTGVSHYVSHLN